MAPRFIALTLLVCALWASVGIGIKLTLVDAPPLGLGAVRLLISAGVLWAWLAWRSPPRWHGVPWRLLAVTTLFYALLQGFTHAGFQHTSAARGIVLLNTTPLFVAVFAHFNTPPEPLNPTKGAGLLLAFAGVVTIFARSIDTGAHRLGDVIMVLGALSWGLHTLATQRATRQVDSGTLVLVQFLGAGVALALLSALGEPVSAWHGTPRLYAGLVYLVLGGTVASWLLWVHVLKNVPAGAASSFIFSVPLIGVALSWLVLGETLTLPFIAGVVLVSLGVTLVNRRRAPAAPASTAPLGTPPIREA